MHRLPSSFTLIFALSAVLLHIYITVVISIICHVKKAKQSEYHWNTGFVHFVTLAVSFTQNVYLAMLKRSASSSLSEIEDVIFQHDGTLAH